MKSDKFNRVATGPAAALRLWTRSSHFRGEMSALSVGNPSYVGGGACDRGRSDHAPAGDRQYRSLDRSIRRPIGTAMDMAVRELAPRYRAPQWIDDFDPGGPGGAPVEVPVFFAEGL